MARLALQLSAGGVDLGHVRQILRRPQDRFLDQRQSTADARGKSRGGGEGAQDMTRTRTDLP